MITRLSPNDLSTFRLIWLIGRRYSLLAVYWILRHIYQYTWSLEDTYQHAIHHIILRLRKQLRLFYSSCTYLLPQLWYFGLFKTCIAIILICSIRTSLIIWYLNINDRFDYMYMNDICCNNVFEGDRSCILSREVSESSEHTIYYRPC